MQTYLVVHPLDHRLQGDRVVENRGGGRRGLMLLAKLLDHLSHHGATRLLVAVTAMPSLLVSVGRLEKGRSEKVDDEV